MEFNIGTILFGIFYSVFIISFFTIFPVALGALYLWFILKMFHRKNLGFWRLIGTSLFSYFSIIMSAIILSFITASASPACRPGARAWATSTSGAWSPSCSSCRAWTPRSTAPCPTSSPRSTSGESRGP